MTRTAVVILNWNGADMMRRFLPGVIANTPEAEIIVADNASTDDSLQVLSTEFPDIKRIVLDRNYGFAEGYNQALRQVEAEYYVLLNSDVETPNRWLAPLLQYMDANPGVAVCQPILRCQWNREYFEYAGAAGGYIDALGYPYCRGRLMSTVEKDNGQYNSTVPIMWATGACMMIRSRDYWQAGGLDGRFFAHQEEIDLCWRLRSRGRGIVCIPDSSVYHLGGGTLPQGNPRKTYLNFRNNLLLLYKNLPDNRLNRVMRIRFWLDTLASIQFLLTFQWGSFLAVWRARQEFYRIRADFRLDREENIAQTVLSPVPEQSTFSLLFQYYVMRRKKYSQLPLS